MVRFWAVGLGVVTLSACGLGLLDRPGSRVHSLPMAVQAETEDEGKIPAVTISEAERLQLEKDSPFNVFWSKSQLTGHDIAIEATTADGRTFWIELRDFHPLAPPTANAFTPKAQNLVAGLRVLELLGFDRKAAVGIVTEAVSKSTYSKDEQQRLLKEAKIMPPGPTEITERGGASEAGPYPRRTGNRWKGYRG